MNICLVYLKNRVSAESYLHTPPAQKVKKRPKSVKLKWTNVKQNL